MEQMVYAAMGFDSRLVSEAWRKRMNWKTEAIQRLEGYWAVRQSLKNIPMELKRLESEARMLENLEQYADARLENLIRRQELSRALEQAKAHTALTEQAFECLCREELRLLELFYIRPRWGNVNRLCIELGLAKSTLYRKRDATLRKFALALYGTAA